MGNNWSPSQLHLFHGDDSIITIKGHPESNRRRNGENIGSVRALCSCVFSFEIQICLSLFWSPWSLGGGNFPRYPWVVGLIEWTLFKIGGRFEFFLLWLLFSRSHAVEPWTAVRKCFAVSQLSYVLLYSSLHFFDVAVVPDICRLFSLCLPCAMPKWPLNLAVTLSAARKRILRLLVNTVIFLPLLLTSAT